MIAQALEAIRADPDGAVLSALAVALPKAKEFLAAVQDTATSTQSSTPQSVDSTLDNCGDM